MHSMQGRDLVGRVVGPWRYPVKSMAGEAMAECEASWHGIAGDRRWAFVKPDAVQSGFPWLTLRQRPDMHHYRPSFVDPLQPDKSATVVRTPSGAELEVSNPALAVELGERIGTSLDVARFRPNIVVEAASGM